MHRRALQRWEGCASALVDVQALRNGCLTKTRVQVREKAEACGVGVTSKVAGLGPQSEPGWNDLHRDQDVVEDRKPSSNFRRDVHGGT